MKQEREFAVLNYIDFDGNFNHLLSQTTSKTRASYAKRFLYFCKSLPNDNLNEILQERINEIEIKRQNGDLKQSTIRQYKASLAFGLSSVACDEADNEFFKAIKESLSYEQAEILYNQVKEFKYENKPKARHLDNIAHLNANTSSHKLKSFPKYVLDELNKCSLQSYERLKLFVNANIIVGLRPSEWFESQLLTGEQLATNPNYLHEKQSNTGVIAISHKNGTIIEGAEGNINLLVKNAKNSHDRSCGDHRIIVLDELSADKLKAVTSWLSYIYNLKKEKLVNNIDEFNQLLKLMQKQLLYFCRNNEFIEKGLNSDYRKNLRLYKADKKRIEKKKNNIYFGKPPIKCYPALYSTRHQSVADAKNSGINPVLIAAIYGHASIKTAQYHYGKANKSYSTSMISPQKESVLGVTKRMTTSQIKSAQNYRTTNIELNNRQPAVNKGNGTTPRVIKPQM